MTTKISADNIQPATLASIGGALKISQIIICDNSYTNLDDTAIVLSGGYIKIIGSGFKTGATVTVNKTAATSVTFISATELRAQVSAQVAGSYIVYVINTDGSVALRVNGLTYSSEPTWVSGGTLESASDTAISVQLAATGASIYTLQAGSTLPTGLTLSSSGLLSGTVTVTNETLYNFTIVATDAELQDSPRAFSITITVGDEYFNSTTLLLPGTVNTFVKDSSTNNFPITVVGDTKPNNFNPYLTGWSNYFDGSGDYLNVPDNAAFQLGAGDFTIEMWINPNSLGSWWLLGKGDGATAAGTAFSFYHGATWDFYYGGSTLSITKPTLDVGIWQHIAVVRNTTTITIYKNGVSVSTGAIGTNSINTGGTNPLSIGQYTSAGLPGYISNFRFVKGTAVYTANFTPPTQPLTAIAGTSLLTCADNRFIDDSANNFVITRTGDVKVQSFSPFVEPQTTRGSAYFDGSGDGLSVPASTALAPLTGDFTYECWAYPTSSAVSYRVVFGIDNYGSGQPFRMYQYGTNFQFWYTGADNISSPTITINTWYHLAVTRTSGVLKFYVNGIQAGSNVTSTLNYPSSIFRIGMDGATTYPFIGYISNLRAVKGTAIYAAAFTPPTTPLTAIENTSLLTLQNNAPVANNTFLDSSSNNLLITRSGSVTQGAFSPYSPTGQSVLLNTAAGTGRSIQTPATLNNTSGTGGNFTLECWAMKLGNSSLMVIAMISGATVSFCRFASDGSATGIASWTTAQANHNTFAPIGRWFHIAACRHAGTVYTYINGQLVNSAANTTNYTFNGGSGSTQAQIGNYNNNTNQEWVGYISNYRIVNGTALYPSGTAFTPSVYPLTTVPNTLLLTCQSNRIVDNSPYASNLTLIGTVKPAVNNWSPFRAVTQTPQTYSAYFDGTNDYLTTPANAAFTLGTGDFTIECWFNRTGTKDVSTQLFDLRTAEPSIAPLLYINGTVAGAPLQMEYYVDGAIRIATTVAPDTNTWYHVAVVRNSGITKLYLNGTQVGSNYTDSNNYVGTVVTVGGRFAAVSTDYRSWFGYISNARIVKGTAVYTANFTPDIAPLTAITNTSLLTCQSTTFVDNSTNKFAITAAGDSKPSTVNPFGSTFSNSQGYTAVDHGGSMYFTNKTDYVAVPATTAVTTFTGNFTFECWVYPTNAAVLYWGLWDGRQSGATAQAMIFVLNPLASPVSGSYRLGYYNGTQYNGTGVVTSLQWTHVAYVRVGTTMTFYINGVAGGTATISGTQTSTATTNPIWIGSKDSNLADYGTVGYISNFRVNNGTALYTSNFVPPAAPALPVQNTTLLLNGTGAAITDATTRNDLETIGDAKISTAVAKFGGSSMSFDGATDYIWSPASRNYDFSGSWTIELWLYFNSVANVPHIWQYGASSASRASLYINASKLRLFSGSDRILGATTMLTGQWYHVAVSFDLTATTTRLFINGTLDGSNTTFNTYPKGAGDIALMIGYQPYVGAATDSLNGYIQDFRVTNGVARYTANFTPPTGAFQRK